MELLDHDIVSLKKLILDYHGDKETYRHGQSIIKNRARLFKSFSVDESQYSMYFKELYDEFHTIVDTWTKTTDRKTY